MWMGKLRELLDSATDIEPAVRNIVDQILDHENIPRKRPKFINFVKNIMRNKASMSNIDKTWDLFSQVRKPPINNLICSYLTLLPITFFGGGIFE